MEINKVNACDVFDDDNDGLIYGVEWDCGDNDFDCMWFKTKKEQDNLIKELENEI